MTDRDRPTADELDALRAEDAERNARQQYNVQRALRAFRRGARLGLAMLAERGRENVEALDHVEMCKALDMVDVLCEDTDCHGYTDPRHEPRALRLLRLAKDEHAAAWTRAEYLIQGYGKKGAPSWDRGREVLIRKNVTSGLRELIKRGCEPEAPLHDLEAVVLALLDEHAAATGPK